jgi:ribosomal protein S18 acetylase RimI-like enzyme
MTTIEELLELDLLTLRAHTERAGDSLDPQRHRESLQASMAKSESCAVRRDGRLAGYALLKANTDHWFVFAFNTHPDHRDASVMIELMRQVLAIVVRSGISELRSHVYKTNERSLNFHRKLGFRVTKENEKAVEFVATVEGLAGGGAMSRVLRRQSRGRPGDPQVAPA